MGCAASSAKYAAPKLGRSRRASHPELAEPDAKAVVLVDHQVGDVPLISAASSSLSSTSVGSGIP